MVEADDECAGLYGEDLDEYINKLKAKAAAFFEQAGQDPIEIYRIEQFEPIKQDPEFHGKFYQGDSYVVLKKQRANYDIHYWHGKEATADEMGSSAALSVQLSGNLNMGSRHHLEEQEMETDLFMSYFKAGLFYLEGGVESGFRHVEPEVYEPRLLHVKGKRYPRVFTVPVSGASLNNGDCFVLDLGLQLYCWFGAEANMFERAKAGEIAQAIKQNDRKMKATLTFVQECDDAGQAAFWEALGGQPASIAPATPDEPPAGTEDERMQYKLWHVSDASGSMVTSEVTERPLTRAHLNDSDSYILELYDTVYIWQGKDSSTKEKYAGMKIAKDFVKKNNKPAGTKVSRLPQGTEDSTFKSFFDGFYAHVKEDFGQGPLAGSTSADQDMSGVATQQVKAKELMLNKLGPLDQVTKTVYFVEADFHTLTPITDPREQGKFFAESCYVIHLASSQHQFFINWLGPRTTSEAVSKMATAQDGLTDGVLTNDMTRIRVKKGHEDEALLSFFSDGFLILDEARVPMDDWYAKVNSTGTMFRVQAPFGAGARAIEQNGRQSQYLNSGDSFTVLTATAGYVWQGMGSGDVEVAAAEKIFASVITPPACSTMKEGEESAEFWESVGGQGDYSKIKEQVGFAPGFEPRLFSVSNTSGYMWMEEVPAFAQEDMLNDDCYILDAYSTIYTWIGNKSNKFEQKGVVKRAEKYLAEIRDNRNKDDTIIDEVLAGREPAAFTVQFIQWEPEVAAKWLETDPEIVRQNTVEESKVQAAATIAANDPFAGKLDPNTNKFTYEVLKSSFPEGVAGTKKEYYLSDEEFAQYIGMSKADWDAQKQWKRDSKKQNLGLF